MNHPDTSRAETSEALADVALNSFGLILILLFAYLLLFRQAAATVTAESSPEPVAANLTPGSDTAEARQEVQRLQAQVQRLENELVDERLQQETQGLWRFRIQVSELVDHREQRETVSFTVDYFLYFRVDRGRVQGALFGVRELDRNSRGSSSHANIVGRLEGSHLEMELNFTGVAEGGSEILSVERSGAGWIGRLTSGRRKAGYHNYTGQAFGTRLNESVFQD